MARREYKLIAERIGLVEATVLLVGMTIGISIFLVPTQMVVVAGPAITVAALAAVVPMLLGVLMMIQLGGALPVAGGVYVYASRLVGPFWGLVGVIIPVVAIWAYLVFAAIGFAQYVRFLVATTPFIPSALLILGVFLAVNYVGIRIAAQVQMVLVAVLLGGIGVFLVAGASILDAAHYTPMFPMELYAEGVAPVLIAAVALYIPLQGFSIIIEIGEELENPVQNIPRVLMLGMTVVTVAMIGVVIVLVGAVPWHVLAGPGSAPVDGGLAAAAALFAPEWVAVLVAVAALAAAATTVNTLITAYSRTVMRAARDELLPVFFSRVHTVHGTPHRAVLLLGLPAILFTPAAVYIDRFIRVAVLDWLVVFIVTGILAVFMVLGVALWRLPDRYPMRYEYSFYRLPLPVLKVVAAGNMAVSLVLAVFVATSMPSALAGIMAVILLGYVGYRYRIRWHRKNGVDLKKRMGRLHKHEQSND